MDAFVCNAADCRKIALTDVAAVVKQRTVEIQCNSFYVFHARFSLSFFSVIMYDIVQHDVEIICGIIINRTKRNCK